MLANSCRLWEDGRPSSFLTWNAVQAYSTMGALDSARAWVERIEGAEGIFAALARATLSLWQGDPASALEALAGQDEPSLRRMMVICGILEATAHVLAEDASGATRKLEDLWRDYPHPRLFRYAFRFIPQDAFESLRDAAAPLPSYIRDLFVDSARDNRTPQWIARPKLTPTETVYRSFATFNAKSGGSLPRAGMMGMGAYVLIGTAIFGGGLFAVMRLSRSSKPHHTSRHG